MEYLIGKKLRFFIHGSVVEGDIVMDAGESVVIKTTQDFLPDSVGQEQTIHKSHHHIEITNDTSLSNYKLDLNTANLRRT